MSLVCRYTSGMTVGYDATRTSHNWDTRPGNFDRLNMRALYPSSNDWGIPDLEPVTTIPTKLVAYNDRYACGNAKAGAAVHFFLDDYRFETMWSQPNRSLSRVRSVGAALTPDFSLWREMPAAMQIWQVYRNRWCGAWMASHGITTIPTVSWSTEASYRYAFCGLPQRGVVAVSTVGIRGAAAAAYLDGVAELIRRVQPSVVVVYGRSLDEKVAFPDTAFIHFPTRWEE